MSDRILNDQRYAVFCKSVIDRETCSHHEHYPGHWRNGFGMCERDTGFSIGRDYFNKSSGSRRFYQERKGGPVYVAHDESYHFQRKEETYIQELETISSNLIRLLSMARQRTVKVKTFHGAPQRPHHIDSYETPVNPEDYRPNGAEPHQRSNSNNDYGIHGAAGHLLSQLEEVLRTSRVTKNGNAAFRMHMADSNADSYQRQPDVGGDDFPEQTSNTPNADSSEIIDRKKKETHNKSEKKRRCFINNRIAELRNLLPDHIDRASCKKKGSILKESIEYIKMLRQDHDIVQSLQRRMGDIEIEIKKMTFKLKQLESKISTLVTIGHVQKSTPEQLENSPESLPYKVSGGQDSSLTLQLPRSEILTTVPVRQEIGQIWDDLTATLTSVTGTSEHLGREMGNDAVEYYHLT